MLLGAHVPSADPLAAATERGAEVIQVFLSAPRAYTPPTARSDAAALRADPRPLYAHAPFILNVVAADPGVRERSRTSLQQACAAAAAIDAAGVVVHGGHVPTEEPSERGLRRWRETLEALETDVPVLIENTAGGANAMARYVDQLERLVDALDGLDVPLGVCLDTCHLHAAGEPLVAASERIAELFGRIDLVHLNDSRDVAGSGRDRHAHLGRGTIDPEALAAVVALADAPTVIETPGDAAAHRADLAWIRARLDGAGAVAG